MIALIVAALCLIASMALWNGASKFTIDASPAGSMMIAASIILFGTSLFMFGVVVGQNLVIRAIQ